MPEVAATAAPLLKIAAPGYVADRLWGLLNDAKKSVNGAKILLLGVTYKPDISDCRESPADPLAARLLSWGADLQYHDPFVATWHPHGVDSTFETQADPYEAAKEADVVVLLQQHKDYDLAKIAAAGTPVLDTRGVMEAAENVERL